MKFLVAATSQAIATMAHYSVMHEGRDTDAAAYNRTDEFLSCSMTYDGTRWLKFDVPSVPHYVTEFADAVYIEDPIEGMKQRKMRFEGSLMAAAVIASKHAAPWYTRAFSYNSNDPKEQLV